MIPDDIKIKTQTIAHQQRHGATVFPYAYLCKSPDATLEDSRDWVAENRNELLVLAAKHGAILFRDFPTRRVEDFDQIVQALDIVNFPYERSLSNAVRFNHTERVFSANEAPPSVRIHLHHEMAQTPLYPRWILFYCEIAAAVGGASPICRSDILYERLRKDCPAFIQDCEAKGLQYSNVMPGQPDVESSMGRSWRDTLGVATQEDAEDRLGELNYTWQWQSDGCLRATTPPLPAVREIGPGRRVFFNQLIAAYRGWKDERNDPSSAIRHGDGSKLDTAAAQHACELADELAFDLPWQSGDFAIVDNSVVMHARSPFEGTRRVFASLAGMEAQRFEIGP